MRAMAPASRFAAYPPLQTALAERAGLRHDGDVATLARRALADLTAA